MHILFISDNFFPESNALANRLYDHARTWVRLGCRVTIITCVPNFPKGKVYSGYQNKWRQREVVDGIRVIRVKTYIAENKGTVKRLLDYMSFGIHSFIQGLFVRNIDLVVGSSPQPFAAISARYVALLKHKPFIFELRDFWPESIYAVGALKSTTRSLKYFSNLMARMYHKADLMVVVTESFKEKLVNEFNIDSKKITICKNGIDIDSITPSKSKDDIKEAIGLERKKFIVGYIGTIGMAHSIETILEAASTQEDDAVHYVIMGAGASAEQIQNESHHMSNVTFIPGGSRQDAINVLNILDAAIVHLRDTPLFKTVIPSKIFETMALEVPILMGVEGESRRIVVNEAHAGVGFKPEDPDALNLAIKQIQCHEFDKNSISRFVKTRYNRRQLAEKMLDDMKQVV